MLSVLTDGNIQNPAPFQRFGIGNAGIEQGNKARDWVLENTLQASDGGAFAQGRFEKAAGDTAQFATDMKGYVVHCPWNENYWNTLRK